MAQILSSEHMYLPDTLWSDQDIYMKSLAYPPFFTRLQVHLHLIGDPSNACLHFIALFRHWGASSI